MTIKLLQDFVGPGSFIKAGTITTCEPWQEAHLVRKGYAIVWDAAAEKREAKQRAAAAKAAEDAKAAAIEARRDALRLQVGPNPALMLELHLAPGITLQKGAILSLPDELRAELIGEGKARPLTVDEAVAILIEESNESNQSESAVWRRAQSRAIKYAAV